MLYHDVVSTAFEKGRALLLGFCVALLAGVLALFFPGGILLAAIGMPATLSLVVAPAVTVAFLGLSGILMSAAGLYGTACLVVGLVALEVLGFGAWLFGGHFFLRSDERWGFRELLVRGRGVLAGFWSPSSSVLLVYALFGVAIMGMLFLFNIKTAAAFMQYSDNVNHMAWIRNFVETGRYSVLGVSAYGATGSASSPFLGASFYPAGWHIVVALAWQMSGVSLAVAENAVNFLVVAVVYPLAMGAFLERVLAPNRTAVFLGAVLCCASAAFPLRPLAVHGIYPNIAGFALVPLLLLVLVEQEHLRGHFVVFSRILVLVSVLGGVALLHPNAVIAAVVLYLPRLYIVVAPEFLEHRGKLLSAKKQLALRAIIPMLISIAVLSLWLALLQAPFMQGIVGFTWQWSMMLPDTFRSLASMGLLLGIPQYALAILCFLGLAVSCLRRKTSWLAGSLLIACVLFIGCSSGNLVIKRFASGFWYTDGERMSAIVAMAAVPVMALGGSCLVRFLSGILACAYDAGCHGAKNVSRKLALISCAFLVSLFLGVNYYPYVAYPGSDDTTAFGSSTWALRNSVSLSDNKEYTPAEAKFVQEVYETVEPGSLIINDRYDGSAFAYSLGGLNTYYRDLTNDYQETIQSKLIRTRLNTIASDATVRDAVAKTGAHYVMLLDKGDYVPNSAGQIWLPSGPYYEEQDWAGFAISDTTPGFQLILREGNMRLYQIL